MQITFTVDDTRVLKKLLFARRGLTNCKKPLTRAGDKLLKLFGIEVFETQGGAIGDSWRALALSTRTARARRTGYYRNPPIRTDKTLIWTGRLMAGMRKKVQPMQLRIYNDVPYFKYHQKRGGKPPQRKMLAITSRVITTVVDELAKYATEVVDQAV